MCASSYCRRIARGDPTVQSDMEKNHEWMYELAMSNETIFAFWWRKLFQEEFPE